MAPALKRATTLLTRLACVMTQEHSVSLRKNITENGVEKYEQTLQIYRPNTRIFFLTRASKINKANPKKKCFTASCNTSSHLSHNTIPLSKAPIPQTKSTNSNSLQHKHTKQYRTYTRAWARASSPRLVYTVTSGSCWVKQACAVICHSACVEKKRVGKRVVMCRGW